MKVLEYIVKTRRNFRRKLVRAKGGRRSRTDPTAALKLYVVMLVCLLVLYVATELFVLYSMCVAVLCVLQHGRTAMPNAEG